MEQCCYLILRASEVAGSLYTVHTHTQDSPYHWRLVAPCGTERERFERGLSCLYRRCLSVTVGFDDNSGFVEWMWSGR